MNEWLDTSGISDIASAGAGCAFIVHYNRRAVVVVDSYTAAVAFLLEESSEEEDSPIGVTVTRTQAGGLNGNSRS